MKVCVKQAEAVIQCMHSTAVPEDYCMIFKVVELLDTCCSHRSVASLAQRQPIDVRCSSWLSGSCRQAKRPLWRPFPASLQLTLTVPMVKSLLLIRSHVDLNRMGRLSK